MQWGTDNPHADAARQRERLSAWLDGALDAAERTELERHLEGCAWCRQELAELRAVRDLLRALPPPRLPRSFALPEDGPLPEPGAASPVPLDQHRSPGQGMAAARAGRASRHPAAWVPAARWLGGIAAVLGLALLSGSLLAGQIQSGNHAQTSSAAAPVSGQHTEPPSGSVRAPEGTASPTPTPSANQSPLQGNGTGPGPSAPPTAAADVPLAPLVGGGLLGGGVIVLVSAGVADRRGRRRASS